MRYLVGRYHEINLKGNNRWRFVQQLKRNLRLIFAGYRLGPIRGEGARLLVELPDDLPEAAAVERAARVFGLQNFSIARRVASDLDHFKQAALELAGARPGVTFRVAARRSDKRFALTSPEIEREVGAFIVSRLGLKVDLANPELALTIEVLAAHSYVSAGKLSGAGGLPVGASGRGLALLSGGIDSPVAAWRMMGRGLALDFVHFHSHPLVSTASRDKAVELAARLARYQGSATLLLAPFAEVQRAVVARVPRALRVLLYRRFMMRIASELARLRRAQVLVTGESLGQVASQTLDNLAATERAAALPVLRPLLAMDKNEIVAQARKLGTFEISILPDEDCCTLFVPAHPALAAAETELAGAEAGLEVAALVARSVERCEKVRQGPALGERPLPCALPALSQPAGKTL